MNEALKKDVHCAVLKSSAARLSQSVLTGYAQKKKCNKSLPFKISAGDGMAWMGIQHDEPRLSSRAGPSVKP